MANDEIVEHHSEEELENVDVIGDQVPVNNGTENISNANELSIHIDAKLQALSPNPMSRAGKIFKVHELLRNVNEKAYEPQLLAIGPYHGSKNHLSAMEKHELRYLKQLLSRTKQNDTKNYASVLWELKGQARACYADPIDLKDHEFVEMMLLDACFIVELFRKWIWAIPTEIGDPILNGIGLLGVSVARDLLLVENQLPFFVLQKFVEITEMLTDKSLCHLIFQYYNGINVVPRPGPVLKDEGYCIQSVEHLLGVLHRRWTYHSVMDSMDFREENKRTFICSKLHRCIKVSEVTRQWFHLPPKRESRNVREDNNCRFICSWFHSSSKMANNWPSKIHNLISNWFYFCSSNIQGRILTEDNDARLSIRCATELKEAGIKFKKVKSINLFAMRFKNGVIEIPKLRIDDASESFFRNLIAYEQFYQETTMFYVTDYIKLMDCLVNTSQDVELLCQCGIIANVLGDDDEAVANMFNRLFDNVIFCPEDYKYKKVFQEVNQHCNRSWNKWKANLSHNYFNTPWAAISFFAALLLLLLALS